MVILWVNAMHSYARHLDLEIRVSSSILCCLNSSLYARPLTRYVLSEWRSKQKKNVTLIIVKVGSFFPAHHDRGTRWNSKIRPIFQSAYVILVMMFHYGLSGGSGILFYDIINLSDEGKHIPLHTKWPF